MNIVQPDDKKGFEREHRPTRAALKTRAAVGAVFGVAIFALWNMGVPHDQALLYEEAKETNVVIASVEVADPMEEFVMHTFEGKRKIGTRGLTARLHVYSCRTREP